jgi:photosystem II stability/assembly factor-like uncharacterized protein
VYARNSALTTPPGDEVPAAGLEPGGVTVPLHPSRQPHGTFSECQASVGHEPVCDVVCLRSLISLLVLACLAAACGSAAGHPGSAEPESSSIPTSLPSPFSDLSYREVGMAKVEPAVAPMSSALAGANDLLVAGSAVLAASDGGLARSVDGGSSWVSVLTGIQMWSLTAAAGGGFVALGDRPTSSGPGQPVIATSPDGLHWRLGSVEVSGGSSILPFGYGYRIAFSGIGASAVGVAVPDIVASPAGGRALRSTDGGRDWVPLSLPDATSGLALLKDGRTLYTTAPGPASHCAGAVYRSADAGATWTLLPGSCQPYPLYSVQFINARDGFAAGGTPAKFNGAQVVEATSDGGAGWQTRWRTPPETGPNGDNEMVRLDMVDRLHGWALTGGCVIGQNGPCGGSVYVTADGGSHWYHSPQTAVSLAGLDADQALVGQPRTGTAVTVDAGQAWQPQQPPSSVSTNALSGAGGWVLWSTSLGEFRSRNSAATWAGFAPPAMTGLPDESWYLAPPGELLGITEGVGSRLQVRASNDDGASWTDVAVGASTSSLDVYAGGLGPGGRAAVLAGPGPCLSPQQIQRIEAKKPGWQPPTGPSVLYTSSDAGSHWTVLNAKMPFAPRFSSSMAISGSVLVTIDACGDLQVSTNTGRTWRAAPLGSTTFCDPSAYQNEIWLVCSSPATSTTWVLHSSNSAATWTAYQLPPSTAINGNSPADNGIVAVGTDAAVMAEGGSLWTTTDGGDTWTQSWPSLTGEQ